MLTSLLLLAACSRPHEKDVAAVQAHYQFRHHGACNSWVTSAVTGYSYCASPPSFPDVPGVSVAQAATVSLKDGPTDEASLRAHGEKVYAGTCAACHQADGKGMAGTFPPLAGNAGFYGEPANHAKIIVHGLTGPIQVAGMDFNGAMPPQGAQLTDYDIAAVATFERTSWGNADGVVLPTDVAAVR